MVDSNNAINNTIGASITGVTNTLTVTNPSDTASSVARTTITVGGSSAGDPSLNFNVSGVTDFEMGIDNNASDSFKLSASTALGTTDTFIMTTAGERTMPLQPSFLGYLATADSNVTGDGTEYTLGSGNALTEVFDRGGDFSSAGVFTAPVTGLYFLFWSIKYATPTSSQVQGRSDNVTSNRRYFAESYNPFACLNTGGETGFTSSVLADMDAGDTATARVSVAGGALTIDITAAAGPVSYFGGNLVV